MIRRRLRVVSFAAAIPQVHSENTLARHPGLAHVPTRLHAPETTGVDAPFNGSRKCDHLYRPEIADVIALAAETEADRRPFNGIQPHAALDLATPGA